jgi:hypothetical protein
MRFRRRKSSRARAVDKLRRAGRRRKSKSARMADSVRGTIKRSGPGKTAQGAGMAGRAAGRGGKAMALYVGRKAAGKRAPLLASLPVLAGAAIGSLFAVRKMRRGVKQTAPT